MVNLTENMWILREGMPYFVISNLLDIYYILNNKNVDMNELVSGNKDGKHPF